MSWYRLSAGKPWVRTPFGKVGNRAFATFLENEGITTAAGFATLVNGTLQLSASPTNAEIVAAVKLIAKLTRFQLLNEFEVRDTDPLGG